MSGSAIDWPKGQSRYAVLANELAKQIQSGKYKQGDFLPAEVRLCETYGVSRFTARQAIQELKKRALVVSRHGIGSEVISQVPSDGEFGFSFDSVGDFLKSAKNLILEIESAEDKLADQEVAKLLGCKAGTPYLFVRGRQVTKTKREPIATVELFVPQRYAEIRKLFKKRSSPGSVGRLIEKNFNVRTEQIHQTIEPILLNRQQTLALGLSPKSAGLLVCRTYLDTAKGIFLHVHNVHAGKHARLTFEIKRNPD
jgi:DNA-binding GntR family transcriptional regulator